MALRDTIFQIQARDGELSEIAADRDRFILAWRQDLEALYGDMERLLHDLMEEGAITIKRYIYKIKEDELGDYEAPGRQLQIANRVIEMAPIARLTSGGAGRVDLFRRDRPSESDRFFVVRRRNTEGEMYWLIEQKKFGGTSMTIGALLSRNERIYQPLRKSSLETALDLLLLAS